MLALIIRIAAMFLMAVTVPIAMRGRAITMAIAVPIALAIPTVPVAMPIMIAMRTASRTLRIIARFASRLVQGVDLGGMSSTAEKESPQAHKNPYLLKG